MGWAWWAAAHQPPTGAWPAGGLAPCPQSCPRDQGGILGFWILYVDIKGCHDPWHVQMMACQYFDNFNILIRALLGSSVWKWAVLQREKLSCFATDCDCCINIHEINVPSVLPLTCCKEDYCKYPWLVMKCLLSLRQHHKLEKQGLNSINTVLSFLSSYPCIWFLSCYSFISLHVYLYLA